MAKADRKHRWIWTGTVQLPPFGKFEKMLDEGEKFVERTSRQQECVGENALL